MKRVKSVNGYTIYEATTQRDVDNYGCQIGSYNIYLSSDIRDFGLSNSYPEWDDIDSLATAIAMCNGSQWATACALAEEISGSTAQDMDLCLEIERRLDAGEALSDVRADLRKVYLDEDELDELDGDLDEDELDGDLDEDDELDGDLEDVLDAALSAGDRAARKHWRTHRSDYRNVYYYCDCCGCTIGKYQTMHCAESNEGDFMVFCDRCIGKQDFLRSTEPEPAPNGERWYVAFFDGDEENGYEKFRNDEEAILGLSYSDNGAHALEIYECNNDETLTPGRMVYPTVDPADRGNS